MSVSGLGGREFKQLIQIAIVIFYNVNLLAKFETFHINNQRDDWNFQLQYNVAVVSCNNLMGCKMDSIIQLKLFILFSATWKETGMDVIGQIMMSWICHEYVYVNKIQVNETLMLYMSVFWR